MNDGAAAVIVASQEAVSAQNLKPLARILSYGDAATHPLDFAVAPTMMFPKILERAGVKQSDVAQWEVNEAFSCVPLAFIKKLGIDASLVNPHGGAVSIGHPIGYVAISIGRSFRILISELLSILSVSVCPEPASSLILFTLLRAVKLEWLPFATEEEAPAEWLFRNCRRLIVSLVLNFASVLIISCNYCSFVHITIPVNSSIFFCFHSYTLGLKPIIFFKRSIT